MKISRKGLENSYLTKHLMGKGISLDLIQRCLEEGVEVTSDQTEVPHPKEGSRYFKMEIPEGAGLPGMFTLPDLNGPIGGEVANLNLDCKYKFRHGKLAPVVRRDQLPVWLVNYASVIFVIIEKNQLPDGRLETPDGPSEEDPEGSWLVVTAHYGPPSRQRPRVPKDCSDGNAVKRYLEQMDTYDREKSRIIFVDLEADGQVGPCEVGEPADEIAELKRIVGYLKEQLAILQKQASKR